MNTNTLRFAALLALSAGLCTLPGLAGAAGRDTTPQSSAPAHLRISIAVDQTKIEETRNDAYRLPADVREGLQSQLIQKLLASGNFDVREREATAAAQGDQERAIDAQHRGSEPANGTHRPARQMRTAADYIVTPTVIGYDPGKVERSGGGLFGVNIGDQKQTAKVSLNIRISDAQTGELIASETASGEDTVKTRGIIVNIGGLNFNSEKFRSSAPGKAIDKALEQAVNFISVKLSGQKWTAKVVKLDELTGRVLINSGSSRGVSAGMELAIYRRSADTTDPDTGAVIPGDEVKVGQISIERVESGYSYGKVTAGQAFKTGDIARL